MCLYICGRPVQTLCDEAGPALERLQRLVADADGLGPSRELPAALQQQLSQARGLLHTLPAQIADRQTYVPPTHIRIIHARQAEIVYLQHILCIGIVYSFFS